jgi:glycosyltransferase involved in cell wall biosynthesis
MRLAFVNRYFWPDHSATSQLLSDLAAELCARGAVVTVFTSRQRYDDAGAGLPSVEHWRGIEIRRIRTSRFGRASLAGRALDYLSFYCSLPFALWRGLRRGDVLVTMTDPPLASVVATPVARLRGAVPVAWVQDLFPEVAVAFGTPRLPSPLVAWTRWLRNRSLRRSAATVAIGERMAELLRAQVGNDARVMTIPNWPHEDAIRPMPAQHSQLRERLGLQDRFVVGYSGNLGRAHDWRAILAVAQALAPDPRVVFLVGGGGHGYDALREQVEAEGLRNVIFQPYHPLEYLSDSMAAADLHLVSLRADMEGLIVPSKFYGIAAAQRPVGFIGDPDGELGRLVREHDIGFALPAAETAGIAEAIQALAGAPETCAAQGLRARQMLESRFSRHEAHRRWHHLLTEVAPK